MINLVAADDGRIVPCEGARQIRVIRGACGFQAR
jgi:hypothetical protein